MLQAAGGGVSALSRHGALISSSSNVGCPLERRKDSQNGINNIHQATSNPLCEDGMKRDGAPVGGAAIQLLNTMSADIHHATHGYVKCREGRQILQLQACVTIADARKQTTAKRGHVRQANAEVLV